MPGLSLKAAICEQQAFGLAGRNSDASAAAEPAFGMMREVDAEMLELGVEERQEEELADFDEEGRRRRLEGSDSASFLFSNGAPSRAHPDASSSCRLCRTGRNLSVAASDTKPAPQDPFLGNTSPHTLKSSSRAESSDSCPASPEVLVGGKSGNDNELDHDAHDSRVSLGRACHRSDSFQRRMLESAQFAEAVGEQSSFLLLRKIIEDSSSDLDYGDFDQQGQNFQEEPEPLQEKTDDHVREADPIINNEIDKQTGEHAHSARSSVYTAHEGDVIPFNDIKHQMGQAITETTVSPKHSALFFQLKESMDPSKEPSIGAPSLNEKPIVASKSSPTRCSQSRVNTDLSTKADLNFLSRSLPSSLSSDFPIHHRRSSRQHSCSFDQLIHERQPSNGPPAGLSSNSDNTFFYKGILANPPEITQRGVSRGNYAQLHRKAWLEVSDKYHRFGKNLRLYYKHWEALGHPFSMFFDWLDSKGDAEGQPLPSIPECPRSILDFDTVLYIKDPDISASYELKIIPDYTDGSAIILQRDGQTPLSTGDEGWIFVLRDHLFYGSQKVTTPVSPFGGSITPLGAGTPRPRQRFHHSSFFGGKAVASAGIFLTNEKGRLTHLYPHSGHYRPGEAHLQRMLFFLKQLGVELSTFLVDMQQIFKISRKAAPKGGNISGGKSNEKESIIISAPQNDHGQQAFNKSKKVECLHLMNGAEVAYFLGHKALMIQKGIFHQIHRIRNIPNEITSNHLCNDINMVDKHKSLPQQSDVTS